MNVRVNTFKHGTWLESEEAAYPYGGQTRKGLALWPDGKLRRVWAGIADTYFSVPAHGRLKGRYTAGWLSVDDSFDVKTMQDSPTHGALLFHPSHKEQQ